MANIVEASGTRPQQLDKIFYFFILFHLLIWTLAPTIFRLNLPMDSMEGTTWGHQLEWGYDKNPFLNGWLTELAVTLGSHAEWVVYLFSQISVVICFWAVFQFAKKIMPVSYALIAVLLLECMQYFNLHAIDFNDNTLELSLWALTTLFFYEALFSQKLKHWFLVALFASLGMMAKYYTVFLLLPMALFILFNEKARASLHHKNFYLGILFFILFITPHTIWLFHHQFITINYVFDRVASVPSKWNHIFYPLQFAWQQFEVFLPALLLSLVLIQYKNIATTKTSLSFNNQFLLFISLGPFLLTLMLSAIMGFKLRAGWGQPLLSFSTVLLIFYLQPFIALRRIYFFITVIFAVLWLTASGYSIALYNAKQTSSAIFPGKNIAMALTTDWHNEFHQPLKYVAGERWLAGNIAFYSKDQPSVYIDWSQSISPWIHEDKLRKNGALFVWDLSDNKETQTIAMIKTRFNTMSAIKTYQFSWYRNKKIQPITVAVTYLPPQ